MKTLDIKVEVASQLGKTNGNQPDPKRDASIIRARRKFYSAFRWSFLSKQADLTLEGGEANLPTDLNIAFEPRIYTYSGIRKIKYRLVAKEELSSYTSASPVFAVDYNAKKILTNLDGVVEIDYQIKVADTIDDDFVEPTPDITPIVLLGVSYYWLASERNDEMHQLFLKEYEEELRNAVARDRMSQPIKRFGTDLTDYGYGD